MNIVILERNADRQRIMRDCLEDRFPQYPIRFFATAVEMLWFLQQHLDEVLAIVLDHDLDLVPVADGRLLGTGRDVADHLATRPAVCPVVILSTNTVAAVGMEQTLQDAGWQTTRITPYGDLECGFHSFGFGQCATPLCSPPFPRQEVRLRPGRIDNSLQPSFVPTRG